MIGTMFSPVGVAGCHGERVVLHVRRAKNGTPSTHPLQGDELRALRRLQRESEPSPFVMHHAC
jgi:hypothetical protein